MSALAEQLKAAQAVESAADEAVADARVKLAEAKSLIEATAKARTNARAALGVASDSAEARRAWETANYDAEAAVVRAEARERELADAEGKAREANAAVRTVYAEILRRERLALRAKGKEIVRRAFEHRRKADALDRELLMLLPGDKPLCYPDGSQNFATEGFPAPIVELYREVLAEEGLRVYSLVDAQAERQQANTRGGLEYVPISRELAERKATA